jgi:putative restriction endonuclease
VISVSGTSARAAASSLGDVIIYTGQGGRDPNTGKQIEHQELTRGNLALAYSELEGLPLRVIRGAGHSAPDPFKLDEGYRYDGLFRVESHWQEEGQEKFNVWRFRLVSLHDYEPVTVNVEPDNAGPSSGTTTQRVETTVQRIIRDTALAKKIKKQYDHRCQVCGIQILTAAGPYAEAAHIKALGKPHDGPDTENNILCLCPNHHVMFDKGVFSIADDLTLLGLPGVLRVREAHMIDRSHLAYHREHFFKLSST